MSSYCMSQNVNIMTDLMVDTWIIHVVGHGHPSFDPLDVVKHELCTKLHALHQVHPRSKSNVAHVKYITTYEPWHGNELP